MPDRTLKPPDPAQDTDYHRPKCLYRVELDDPYEVRYWTHLYKITEKELRILVVQLGSDRNSIEIIWACEKLPSP